MRVVVVACALLVGACATVPGVAPVATEAPADTAFDVSGRLSAKRGSDAAVANFDWAHAPERDVIALATPMGTTLAELTRDAGGATLVRPDRAAERAPDVATLADRALGMPLPVESLAWWIRAVPHPRSAHAIERDASGRAAVLRQDGWAIVYSYAEGQSRPRVLVASYPDLEVRVVVDAWR